MFQTHDPEVLMETLRDDEEYLILVRRRGSKGETFAREGMGSELKPWIMEEIISVEDQASRPLILNFMKMDPLEKFMGTRNRSW